MSWNLFHRITIAEKLRQARISNRDIGIFSDP